ncbi:hypothetical protein RFN29_15065 [Mesorhizobium sp. VK22B]|uniref:Uncharacterized protein n=1 Tax=Mesorhizobium captivum TaxID=3072319 RepID=A0ABU4Z0X6_9HYPH|nr:hypothetical protein [Mesorhizobium sp. VK22B]MDX8492897.1 hypothetical protein [Mesorhizobium sp. VK22B]
MSFTARIAREEAITEALRAINDAIGDEVPTVQAFKIIDAIKRLRDGQPIFAGSTDRIDYLERARSEAQAAWMSQFIAMPGRPQDDASLPTGPEHDATAGVDTPLGRLRVTTWRRPWAGAKGERIAWASEYYLNDQPITVAEIKAMGLAQRPTTRNRKRS